MQHITCQGLAAPAPVAQDLSVLLSTFQETPLPLQTKNIDIPAVIPLISKPNGESVPSHLEPTSPDVPKDAISPLEPKIDAQILSQRPDQGKQQSIRKKSIDSLKDSPKKSIQKCQNKLCANSENLKRVKSRADERMLLFCKDCAGFYSRLQFCEVCEQIYSSSEEVGDGLEWVLCENEGCKRWNHTECEKRRGRFDSSQKYFCSECEKKPKRKRAPAPLPYSDHSQEASKQTPTPKNNHKNGGKSGFQDQLHPKITLSEPLTAKCEVFSKKREVFNYLQTFLNSCSGYKIALTDEQVMLDIQRLSQGSTDMNFADRIRKEKEKQEVALGAVTKKKKK